MTNKNMMWLVVVVVVIIGAGVYFATRPMSVDNSLNSTSYNPQTQGKVVFGVTDAAGSMGDVSSVVLTVNQIQVHSEANGWVTVSNETKQYDLLALKQSGAVSLLANANLTAGTYDQVKLTVTKVTVTKAGVVSDAKLPSGELKLVGNIVVNADKTSSVVFDFMADKSLHTTGNGKFIFAPVIKLRQQAGVNVAMKSGDELSITGGDKEQDDDFGMDEKGDVKSDFELKGNLNIDSEDKIEVDDNNSGKVEIKSILNND